MRTAAIVFLASLSLAGCSSFRLGAMCYLPAGMSGSCTIDPPGAAK